MDLVLENIMPVAVPQGRDAGARDLNGEQMKLLKYPRARDRQELDTMKSHEAYQKEEQLGQEPPRRSEHHTEQIRKLDTLHSERVSERPNGSCGLSLASVHEIALGSPTVSFQRGCTGSVFTISSMSCERI
jgi:hypothetical protein